MKIDEKELIKKIFDGEITLEDLLKDKNDKDCRHLSGKPVHSSYDSVDDTVDVWSDCLESAAAKLNLSTTEYLAVEIPKLKEAIDNLDIEAVASFLQLCHRYNMWDNAIEVYNKYSVVSLKKYFEIYPDGKTEYLNLYIIYFAKDSSSKYGYKLSLESFDNCKNVKFCDLPKDVQPEAESLILGMGHKTVFKLENSDIASLYYLAGDYEKAFVEYDHIIMGPYLGDLYSYNDIQDDYYYGSSIPVIKPLFSDTHKDHIVRYIKLYNELDPKIVEVGREYDDDNTRCRAFNTKRSLASYEDVMAFCIVPGIQSILRTQRMYHDHCYDDGYDWYFWEFNRLARVFFKDFKNDFPEQYKTHASFVLPTLDKIAKKAEKIKNKRIKAEREISDYEYRQAHPEDFIDDEGFHPGESPEEFWSHED